MMGFRDVAGMIAVLAAVGGAGCATYDSEGQAEPGTVEQGAGQQPLSSFSSLDQNNDGVLVRDEITDEAIIGNWETIDTNNDGLIDSAEFAAFETANP